jgi:Zn-dependent protease with chaperone function
MQFHGALTKSGTTIQVEAALLVSEPNQPAGSLFLARADARGVDQVTIAEVLPMIGGGDTRLRLSTGDIFRLPAGREHSKLESFYPRRSRMGAGLSRLENVRWRGVVALSIAFVFLAIGIRFAIAPVGDAMARMMPPHLVERASKMVLTQLDLVILGDSTLPQASQDQISKEFERLLALAPAEYRNTRLHFRSAPGIGPNAFALPGNDIVLLDELVTFADDDDVVLGVLAHELGHVAEQHALRQVMRSAVVAIGVSLMVGSEESILEEVAGFGGSLVLMENSRAFELEADHLSADWMAAIGRDPQALVRFFQKIAKECGERCDGGSMLASHPSFSERIEALSD